MKVAAFNACLVVGWVMLTAGLSLMSLPLGLAVGGGVLMGTTLLMARWAGVTKAP